MSAMTIVRWTPTGLKMDKVTELQSDEEWKAAVAEQRLRVRFDADPRVKAARKAYKLACVGRKYHTKEAWETANAVYTQVRNELRAELAACTDVETF